MIHITIHPLSTDGAIVIWVLLIIFHIEMVCQFTKGWKGKTDTSVLCDTCRTSWWLRMTHVRHMYFTWFGTTTVLQSCLTCVVQRWGPYFQRDVWGFNIGEFKLSQIPYPVVYCGNYAHTLCYMTLQDIMAQASPNLAPGGHTVTGIWINNLYVKFRVPL